jgi:hypothetical protein
MAHYYADANYGGLGYTPGQSSDTPSHSGAPSVAGGMIQNLMQQCLAYHEQQKSKTIREEPPEHSRPFVHSSSDGSSNTTPSTTAGVPQTVHIPTLPPQPTLDQVAADGRSRATAILQKFQQLTQAHDGTEASEFRIKREQCFAQENQRKTKFWIKNFEFVARRDALRLQQQMANLNEAKHFEAQMQEQYKEALEQRKRRLLGGNNSNSNNNNPQNSLTSQAGIGTSKRKRVEKEKKRSGHLPSSSQEQDSSVAVYLSGLPTDGSVPEATLQALFGSYGSLRKIHLYRNKQTSDLKGDALVIYQIGKGEKKHELLQTVCSQVRGRIWSTY